MSAPSGVHAPEEVGDAAPPPAVDTGSDEGLLDAPAEVAATRRLGGFALVVLISALLVGVYAVHAQLPANAVTLPYETSLREPAQVVFPQGWAFFTRSPREADPLPYVRGADGRWQIGISERLSDLSHGSGFSRAARARGVEIGLLMGSVTEPNWRECREEASECLDRAPAVAVANVAHRQTLCGDVGLVRRLPVPWAWSRSASEITMPSTVVRLAVSC